MFKNKRTAMVVTLVVAVFISLSILMVPGKAFAAYDAFIIISGIQGESTDQTHRNWIDVYSWSFGETLPSATAGGATARVTMQDFKFTKRADIASPLLFLACARAQRIPTATLEVRSIGTVPVTVLSIKLSDVIVSSFETLGNSGSIDLLEKVSLNFGKIEITYTPIVSGAAGPNVTGGWDLRSNLGVGSLPTSPPSISYTRVGATVVAAGKTTQPSQAICFIKVGGFEGESTDKTHAGWIDVITWGFGETQPTTVISLTSAGSVRPVNLQDFRFTMRMNKASPLLFLASASGVIIPQVMLEVYRPGMDTGDANLRITLSNVVISSFLSLGSGQSIMEEISLKFGKINIRYTPGGRVVEFP